MNLDVVMCDGLCWRTWSRCTGEGGNDDGKIAAW